VQYTMPTVGMVRTATNRYRTGQPPLLPSPPLLRLPPLLPPMTHLPLRDHASEPAVPGALPLPSLYPSCCLLRHAVITAIAREATTPLTDEHLALHDRPVSLPRSRHHHIGSK
jgi:hypothetical protein